MSRSVNKCLDCQFAQWRKTVSGRPHPDGTGRCMWKKSVALPVAIPDRDRQKIAPILDGGYWWIGRKEHVPTCPTYVRAMLEGEGM